jgi:DNA uptake protein ComE-like DNA-binding protein
MKRHDAPDMADDQRDHRDRRMLVLFLFVVLLIITDFAAHILERGIRPAALNLQTDERPEISREKLDTDKQGGIASSEPRAAFFLGRPMQLNQATAADLELLMGVGPVLAKRIIAFRNQHACIHNMNELRHIRGLGDKMASRLTGQLAFECQ